jgi:trehalose/maltose hydrolase-like predicted phosphorylase
MKTHEALSEALGIEHEILPPVKIEQKQEIVESENAIDQQEDYRLARKTFRSLIDKGNNAMENLTDLAKESESPRAYEVLATMMKTIADTTKDLYDLQKKTKDLQKENKSRPQDDQRINVEKAVFVGTTAELLKKVKNNEEL